MKTLFGKTPEGQEVYLYTLDNGYIEAKVMNYGAILVSLTVPDKAGNRTDVVLGFDDLAPYLGAHPCFGTINGRYANRIAKGQFSLDGKSYSLAINNGENHLHGGIKGIDKVLWDAESWKGKDGEPGVKMSYLSPDGEEGYPGNLHIEVIYSLTKENGLHIAYKAETDAPTVLNLTNHSYFNLAGKDSAMEHEVQIFAETFTPTDEGNIPTGELQAVAGTPFDFRSFKKLSADIEQEDLQLLYGSGYDHNFVVEGEPGSFRKAAIVREAESGRIMEVFSTEPGVQLYTANNVKGILGKNGQIYGPRYALCLELQHFPDSPNHAHFPSTRLNPGEIYTQETEYRFSTK